MKNFVAAAILFVSVGVNASNTTEKMNCRAGDAVQSVSLEIIKSSSGSSESVILNLVTRDGSEAIKLKGEILNENTNAESRLYLPRITP